MYAGPRHIGNKPPHLADGYGYQSEQKPRIQPKKHFTDVCAAEIKSGGGGKRDVGLS